jgi:hypothetical protein
MYVEYDFIVSSMLFTILSIIYSLKDERNQNGFLHFWTECYEYNIFADFLKLFEVVDMDGSFFASCSI